MRTFLKLFLYTLINFGMLLPITYAWNCHFLLSHQALQNDKNLTQETIPAETLAQFLEQEKTGLVKLLSDQEAWSRQHILYYPALPDNLIFKADNHLPLQKQFIQAIRVNPELAFKLFLQYPPGKLRSNRPEIPRSAVMLPSDANAIWILIPNPPLVSIAPGELVHPIEVISTASDEPDYGMDINLWQDNSSWFGKIYGFGDQPFGNKNVEFSSQAPFHIGYFYERWLTYKMAPFIKKCYIEYRIHLYLTLSRYAFATKHPYWGYRFLGWGLHYIQDLTQPYHTTVAPNVSLWKIVWASVGDIVGIHGPKQNVIQLISNRHFSLENYQYFLLLDAMKPNSTHADIATALINQQTDGNYPAYTDNYPRDVVGKASHQLADQIDEDIRKAFPKKYVEDPKYLFYITDPEVNLFLVAKQNDALNALNAEIITLMTFVGAHTRNVTKYILNAKPN